MIHFMNMKREKVLRFRYTRSLDNKQTKLFIGCFNLDC